MRISHPKVDFNYFSTHCDQTKFEIPYYYDKVDWKKGETYQFRVSNIYDPTKFWVVLKHQELDIFQEFLLDFYTKHGDAYKMTLESLSRNIYCAAYCENSYYRGIIISIPHSTCRKIQVCVFLFDYGYVTMVNFEDIYFLYEKLYEIPRFAVRASLSHIRPYDSQCWGVNSVTKFNDLVTGRILLGILEYTDRKRRILEIAVGYTTELSSVVNVGDTLISDKIARGVLAKDDSILEFEKGKSRYVPITKYPYLFPSFEAIESGFVPPSVNSSDILTQCIARDVLYRPYFIYRGVDSSISSN